MQTDLPTPERLHELFVYAPATGVLHWRKNLKPAGTNKGGYIRFNLHRGKFIYAHRAIWAMFYGAWPEGVIDHINGNRADNCLANLRNVTQQQNMQNLKRAHSDSKWPLGVTQRASGKFSAQIWVNRSNKYLGLFDTPEAAHNAYLTAKRNYHEGNTL